MDFRLSKIAPLSILFISYLSISGYLSLRINSEIIKWSLSLGIVIIFSILPFFSKQNEGFVLIKILLVYYGFSIFRGFFIAETYWDFKGLFDTSITLLLSTVALAANNLIISRNILIVFLKYGLILLLLLIPFLNLGALGFYLAPLSVIILFIPTLSKFWRIIILLLCIISILFGLGARSNVIKLVVPFLFLSFYYFPILRSLLLMKLIRLFFIITPIMLFYLAVSGLFNVFNMNDYVKTEISISTSMENGKSGKDDLKADTRTLLYKEVLESADNNNSWWIGRSPARGNDTKIFAEYAMKITGRAERLSNEAAILNIFTWTGIIGVLLYFLVFYQASYLALYKSKNIYSQMLGMYISFRWLFAWIEDPNYFTSNTFILWLAIGLCFSKKFRNMTNLEVKLWFNGINYRRIGNRIFFKNLISTWKLKGI